MKVPSSEMVYRIGLEIRKYKNYNDFLYAKSSFYVYSDAIRKHIPITPNYPIEAYSAYFKKYIKEFCFCPGDQAFFMTCCNDLKFCPRDFWDKVYHAHRFKTSSD
jgi:hypothetical protein